MRPVLYGLFVLFCVFSLPAAPASAANLPRVVAELPTGPVWAIAIDSSANIWATNKVDTLYKVTQSGAVTTIATGLNGPYGLAFDSAGNLFIAEIAGDVVEIPHGTTTVQPFISGENAPRGLAFDAAGNLFIALNGGVDEVPFGTTSVVHYSTTDNDSQSLGQMIDVAVGPDGNIYASSFQPAIVYQIPPGTAPVTATQYVTANLDGPTGLAFDAAGNLYIANFGGVGNAAFHNDIVTVPAGAPALSTPSIGYTGANNPEEMTFFQGHLYVANSGSNEIVTDASPIPTLGALAALGFGLALASLGCAALYPNRQAGRLRRA
jgi:sugar lactone lactonase YvrE